jgi:hypothetical protein
MVVTVTRGFLSVITFAKCQTIFQKCCLELINATLFQCFIKQSTIEAYNAVDIYLNPPSTTALVTVVLLPSTPNRYFPTERTTGTHWKRRMAREPEWTHWTLERSLAQLGEATHLRIDRRLTAIHIELPDLKVNFVVFYFLSSLLYQKWV